MRLHGPHLERLQRMVAVRRVDVTAAAAGH